MKLEELSSLQADIDRNHIINEIRELMDNTIQDTRSLTFEISPLILYELGFEPAVEWLIEQFKERHSIPIEYEVNCNGSMLKEDMSLFLFKSVRELLFNAIKHAHAEKIKVLVKREQNRMRISIKDDGVGFDFSKVEISIENLSGFGLFSIRERMEHFGGKLNVESKPGKGALITLIMPLKKQEGDRSAER
jgi:signal transduction histidine kinase